MIMSNLSTLNHPSQNYPPTTSPSIQQQQAKLTKSTPPINPNYTLSSNSNSNSTSIPSQNGCNLSHSSSGFSKASSDSSPPPLTPAPSFTTSSTSSLSIPSSYISLTNASPHANSNSTQCPSSSIQSNSFYPSYIYSNKPVVSSSIPASIISNQDGPPSLSLHDHVSKNYSSSSTSTGGGGVAHQSFLSLSQPRGLSPKPPFLQSISQVNNHYELLDVLQHSSHSSSGKIECESNGSSLVTLSTLRRSSLHQESSFEPFSTFSPTTSLSTSSSSMSVSHSIPSLTNAPLGFHHTSPSRLALYQQRLHSNADQPNLKVPNSPQFYTNQNPSSEPIPSHYSTNHRSSLPTYTFMHNTSIGSNVSGSSPPYQNHHQFNEINCIGGMTTSYSSTSNSGNEDCNSNICTRPDQIIPSHTIQESFNQNNYPSTSFMSYPPFGASSSLPSNMNMSLFTNPISISSSPSNTLCSSNGTLTIGAGIPKKISLYKTEFCRSFEETGFCRYGLKCQFAHDRAELRVVPRHPRYKTEICRTFWELGNCPYGKRCCFIHLEAGSALPPNATLNSQPPPPNNGNTPSSPLLISQESSGYMPIHNPINNQTNSRALSQYMGIPTTSNLLNGSGGRQLFDQNQNSVHSSPILAHSYNEGFLRTSLGRDSLSVSSFRSAEIHSPPLQAIHCKDVSQKGWHLSQRKASLPLSTNGSSDVMSSCNFFKLGETTQKEVGLGHDRTQTDLEMMINTESYDEDDWSSHGRKRSPYDFKSLHPFLSPPSLKIEDTELDSMSSERRMSSNLTSAILMNRLENDTDLYDMGRQNTSQRSYSISLPTHPSSLKFSMASFNPSSNKPNPISRPNGPWLNEGKPQTEEKNEDDDGKLFSPWSSASVISLGEDSENGVNDEIDNRRGNGNEIASDVIKNKDEDNSIRSEIDEERNSGISAIKSMERTEDEMTFITNNTLHSSELKTNHTFGCWTDGFDDDFKKDETSISLTDSLLNVITVNMNDSHLLSSDEKDSIDKFTSTFSSVMELNGPGFSN